MDAEVKIGYFRPVRVPPLGWEYIRSVDSATKSELEWYFFLGDVRLAADGVVLETTFGSIPAIHFIGGLLYARDEFSRSDPSRYEYYLTEVDEVINFGAKVASSK